jgi:lysozyme
MDMTLSESGLNRIKSFEDCSLTAYQDSGGVWTIGWGYTGPGISEGVCWTQSLADAMLIQDVSGAVAEVNRCVTVPLSQGEFDALVSFVYNVGDGQFESSSMLRLLNAGEYALAADQFDRWDHVHGFAMAGLLRRRMAEEQEFDS